jgi:hypothetical protein
MDPLSGSTGSTPGQSPTAASLSLLVTIVAAPPKQTLAMTGTTVLASALGDAQACRPLKKKKLGVKKSAL